MSARNSLRTSRAQSLIELTGSLIVLVPVLLVLLDLAVIVIGVQMNDSACRNAVRAAASGEPTQAQARAQTAIDNINAGTHGAMVSNFSVVLPIDIRILSQPQPPASDSGEKNAGEAGGEETMMSGEMAPPEDHGGAIIGTATVTTEVEVRPFIVQNFYGGSMPLKFRSRQTFPISYIRPAKK